MKKIHYIMGLMAVVCLSLISVNAQAAHRTGVKQEVKYLCSGDSIRVHYGDTTVVLKNEAQYTFKYQVIDPVLGDTIDSTYTIVTHAALSMRQVETYTLVQGNTYEWHGQQVTGAGTYEDVHTSIHGCDSSYVLNVTVVDRPCQTHYGATEYREICQNDPQTWQGQTLDHAGVYHDTIQTTAGCDSVLTLVVNYYATDTIWMMKSVSDQQLPYEWNGQQYNASGTYAYTTKSALTGCDSVCMLVLTVNRTYLYGEEATICASELPYEWRGQSLTQSGVYEDHLSTKQGLDSVYTLKLTVNEAMVKAEPIRVTLCTTDKTYTYDGQEYGEGIHRVTLKEKASNGCDSVVTLNIKRVYPTVMTSEDTYEGAYSWRGKTLTQPGVYYDTLRTSDEKQCDSLYYVLTLREAKSYLMKDSMTICENQLPYTWNGHKFLSADVYYQTYTTVDGKDSTYEYILKVNPTLRSTVNHTICEGDSIVDGDIVMKATGVYNVTKTSLTTGCDSIVSHVVEVKTPVLVVENQKLIHGEKISWHGEEIDHAGTFEKEVGCDTLYRLIVTEIDPLVKEEKATVCRRNLPYEWMGQKLYSAGEHTMQFGLDSTYKLDLTILDPVYTQQILRKCAGEAAVIDGKTYYAPAHVTDTLQTILGCDSIVEYILTSVDTTARKDEHVLTDAEREAGYKWTADGKTYYNAGLYTYAHQTTEGCTVTDSLKLHASHTLSMKTCAETPLIINGKTYREAGMFTDTIAMGNGVDSILIISITHYASYVEETSKNIAQGDSIEWRGKIYKTSGTYVETETDEHGCEAKYILNLAAWPTYIYKDSARTCEGENYLWHGQSYNQAGVYTLPLKTVHGMDSIYELHLEVLKKQYTTVPYSICPGDTLRLNEGKLVIAESGRYQDTLKSMNSCDSIVTYEVTVKPGKSVVENAMLHEGEQIKWYGDTIIRTPGSYTYRLSSGEDDKCPTVYILHVTVTPNYVQTDTVVVCENELPYRWRGLELTKDSTYRVPLSGTDKVGYYELTLKVNKRTYGQVKAAVCDGDSVNVGGKMYGPGEYTDTLKNVAGCDSIQVLILNVWPSYHMDTTVTVCENELPFHYHGNTYSATGVYTDRYQTVHGFDSIYTLNLTVNKVKTEDKTIQLCEGSTYDFAGKTISEPGVYKDTTTSAVDGCDSITTLYVQKAPVYKLEEYAQISTEETYTWAVDGKTYNKAGDYYAYFKTKGCDCDSTHVLHLQVYPTYHMDTTAEVCQTNTPFEWHNMKLYETGDYIDHLTSSHGYDSIYTLHLTVIKPVYEDVTLMLCKGDSIEFNGKMYNKGGIYEDADNCARAYRITVKEYIPRVISTTAQLHGNQAYYWSYGKNNERNETLSEPGVYERQVKDTESGCNDIYRLTLLSAGAPFLSEETATICEGEEFIWRGRDLSRANVGYTKVYYDSLQTAGGMDSVYMLTLTIGKKYDMYMTLTACKGGSINWNGRNYTTGTYVDSLYTVLGCDSLIHITVTEANSYYIEDTATLVAGESFMWYGTKITKNGDYYYYGRTAAGCDSTLVLHVGIIPAQQETWLMTEEHTMCAGEEYEWHNRKFYTSGTYYDSLKCKAPAQLGRDSVYMLKLTVWPKYEDQTKHIYVCHEGDVTYEGKTYTKDMTYPQEVKLTSIHGCDSIINLYVHFNASYEHYDTLRFNNTETRTWQGQIIRNTGDYTAAYKSIAGCDSVYYLHAEVKNVYIDERDTAVCQNKAGFEWHGLTIGANVGTTTYTATDSIPAGDEKIQMTYILNVTVWPVYEENVQLSICTGSSVTYGGQKYTEAGDYDIVTKGQGGCDSIIHVHVNSVPSYHRVTEAYINTYKHQTYTWNGNVYTTSGTYTVSKQNEYGCMDIDELVLRDLPVKHDTIVKCHDELPFEWHGHKYSTSDSIYEEYYERDSNGVDTMMYTLNLSVLPEVSVRMRKDFCRGEEVNIGGKIYTESYDDAVDTLKNINGCDSLVHWMLVAHDPFSSEETRYLRDGNSFEWVGHDTIITTPGYYTDHHESVWGCDSTYNLRVLPLKVVLTDTTICELDTPYVWRQNGNKYYESYEAYEVKQDRHGLDSVEYRLKLTVTPQERDTIVKTLCYGEKFAYADTIWSGNVDTVLYVPQANLCSKIVILKLHEVQPYNYDSIVYLRNGETMEWHGKTIPTNRQFKIYTDTTKSVEGCDSIFYSMDVRLLDSIPHDTIVCENDPSFIWRGKEIVPSNGSDTITDVVKDEFGHDSIIYTLNLKVMPKFDTIVNARICDNQLPYVFRTNRGITFTHDSEGVYIDTIPTVYGCDSIFHINLQVYPAYHIDTVDTICESQLPYIVGPDTLWNEGYYTIKDTTKECGCDSIVNLRLVIRPTMDHNDSITMCKQDLPYYLGDTLGVKARYPESQYKGLPFYTDTVIWDCDKKHFFHVIVRDPIQLDDIYFCAGDSVQFGSYLDGRARWIKETGVYYDTIYSHETYSQAADNIHCDSILRVNAYKLAQDTVVKKVHILNDSTYEFYGRYLNMSGIYYARDTMDTVPTGTDIKKRRCNDMIELHLIVDTVYRFRDSVHYCMPVNSYEYYQWIGGHWQGDDGILGPDGQKKKLKIEHSGIYTDSLRREVTRLSSDNYYKNFKDSIYTLVVTMDTAYIDYRTYKLCKGDSVQFNNKWYHDEGIYLDTLHTVKGCDSIVQYTVNFIQKYEVKLADVRINDRMTPYVWTTKSNTGVERTHLCYNTGLYYDTLKTADGCDSVLILPLEVAKTYQFDDSIHVCSTFNGEEHTHQFADGHEMTFRYEGDYYDSLRTTTANPTWAPDSIYHLNVVVHFSERTRKDTIICRDDSVMFNGEYITEEGIYYQSFRTMPRDSRDTCHCDSVVEWNVKFAEHYFVDEGMRYIANPGSYLWHMHGSDTLLTTQGVFFDKNQSVYGCDSIYKIEIRYAPTYRAEEEKKVCESELPYRWHGRDLYKTGLYYDSLQTSLGFDSIFRLDLTVLDTAHTSYIIHLCEGSSATYNGVVYSKGGQYHDTLTCVNGCDSIVTITVQIMPKYFYQEMKETNDKNPITWHGKTYTQEGIYYDSLRSVYGCDSIYELTLHVYNTYRFDEEATVCAGELPYIWHGKTLNKSGLYFDSLQSVHRADSVYSLKLTVLDSVHVTKIFRLCQDEVLSYNGHQYTKAGQYHDTLTCVNGCDSIVTINLQYMPKYLYKETHETNDKKPFMWHGKTYTQEGIYYDTLTSVNGCDSVFEMTLHVYKSYEYKEQAKVCAGDLPYIWHGKTYNESGLYYDSLQSIHHADSVYSLSLTVLDTAHAVYNIRMCEGGKATYNGVIYDKAGQYHDTLACANGCDSIVTINVQVMPKYFYQETATTNNKKPYTWHGKTYTQEGIYYDTLQSVFGCDSIYELTLHVYNTYRFDTTATVCESNLPFIWHGKTYNESGLYFDSLQSVHRTDSVYSLQLTVLDTAHAVYNIQLCEGSSATYNGVVYSKGGQYHDTLTCKNGCDSIVTINVQVMPKFRQDFQASTSSNVPYYWHGKYYTRTGVYTDSLTSVNGCDSISRLFLTVYETSTQFENVTTCESELPYEWHGHKFLTDTIYVDSLQSVHGADSIWILNLNVLDTAHALVSYTLCQGEILDYNGRKYTQAGRYSDTLKTAEGCDSIVTISLQYMPKYLFHETKETNDKKPFKWHGKTYTQPGVYFDTLQSVYGCDSIYELTLNVFNSYRFEEQATVCEGELPYLWHGRTFNQAGLYYDSLQSVHHADSIYSLHLTILDSIHVTKIFTLCQGEILDYNGRKYTQAGRYSDTLKTAEGCDSIVTISLQYMPKYLFHETKETNDKNPVFWHNKTYTQPGVYYDTLQSVFGCDSIYELTLRVYNTYRFNEQATVCANDLPYIWHGKTYNESGLYYDSLQSVHYTDSVYSLQLTVLDTAHAYYHIQFCEGDSAALNGKWYSKAGLYTDTLATVRGCDSILHIGVQIRLTERRPPVTQKVATNKLPYVWAIGDTAYNLRTTGTYEHVIRSVDGLCDSIVYTLNLKVCPTYDIRLDTMVCTNDLPYRWLGRDIWDSGTYTDTLQTVADHMDSIMSLTIKVLPNYFGIQTIDLCQGSSAFKYRGVEYPTDTVIFDTIPSVMGCDSIFKISVRYHPNYEVYDTVNISDQEAYPFFGRNLRIEGLYHYYGKTGSDCDSIIHLFLRVHPTYRIEQEANICKGDTFLFGDSLHLKKLTKEGIYIDSLLTKRIGDEGYDSIIVLDLKVWPTYLMNETYTICPGDSMYIRGRNVSKPGEYWDTLYTVHGCDSVIHFVVNQIRAYQLNYTYTLCDGDSVEFHGKKYGMTGDYYFRSPERCDTVEHMHLVVYPAYYKDTTILIRKNIDWPFNFGGKQYLKAGDYKYNMKTSHGCDSVLTIHLKETDKYSIDPDRVPMCDGEPILLNNRRIEKPGEYRFFYRSDPRGDLDSIRIVEVYIAQSYHSTRVDTLTMCEGDTLKYGGHLFTHAGKDSIRYSTTAGCDSVLYYYIRMYKSYHMPPLNITTTDVQPYEWYGRLYDSTGVYTHKLMTIHGCDSVETLNLLVLQTEHYETKVDLCLGEEYIWRRPDQDTTIRTSGLYVYVMRNGTKSVSYTLLSTVYSPVVLTGASIANVCADADNADIELTYEGTPATYSVLFDAAGKKAGFKDVVDAAFASGATSVAIPLPKDTNHYYYDGTETHNGYVSPGDYTVKVQVENGPCASSVVTTTLSALYPAWIMQQNWQDVVAILNAEHNGGYEFRSYYWKVNDVYASASPYLYDSRGFDVGTKIELSLSRYSGEPLIPVCEPLYIKKMAYINNDSHPYLAPTTVSRSAPRLTLKADHDGTYRVISINGLVVEEGTYTQGKQDIMMPAASGCYVIRTESKSGKSWSDKVIVY